MSVRSMFPGSSCAGAVAAGVACFFIGLVMLIWGIWDLVGYVDTNVVVNSIFRTFLLSILIWLLGWYFLHIMWRSQLVKRRAAFKVASVLALLGIASSLLAGLRFFIS